MFDEIGKIIYNNEVVATASDFNMGIEVEMLRVNSLGELSRDPYPAAIGNQRENHYIKNDFLQMQTEIITPPTAHSFDALRYLMALNDTLRNALAPNELLWPLSMPPALPEDKSQIPISDVAPKQKAYYEKWAKIHGFTSGLPTGVHLNASINDKVIEVLWAHLKDKYASYTVFINYLYAKLAQGFVLYHWLLTYLFGAAPIAEQNFFEDNEGPDHLVRSLRSSHYGLGNKLQGDFTSVKNYVHVIKQGIADGELLSDAEFHGSLRFKSDEGGVDNLLKDGTSYLELRMLDLDPTSAVGVRTSTVLFVRMLLTYFMMMPGINPNELKNTLAEGPKRNEQVALENPLEPTAYHEQAQAFLDRLQRFGAYIQWGPEYQETLDVMQDRVDDPRRTPAANLTNHIVDNSLTDYALRIGSRYQRRAHQNPHPFKEFQDRPDMPIHELRKKLFKGMPSPTDYDINTGEAPKMSESAPKQPKTK